MTHWKELLANSLWNQFKNQWKSVVCVLLNCLIFQMFHTFLVFAIGHHAHMSPLIHIDTLEHCTSSKIFIEKGQTSSQRQDLTCQQNCVTLGSWYTFGVRGCYKRLLQKFFKRIAKSLQITTVWCGWCHLMESLYFWSLHYFFYLIEERIFWRSQFNTAQLCCAICFVYCLVLFQKMVS